MTNFTVKKDQDQIKSKQKNITLELVEVPHDCICGQCEEKSHVVLIATDHNGKKDHLAVFNDGIMFLIGGITINGIHTDENEIIKVKTREDVIEDILKKMLSGFKSSVEEKTHH